MPIYFEKASYEPMFNGSEMRIHKVAIADLLGRSCNKSPLEKRLGSLLSSAQKSKSRKSKSRKSKSRKSKSRKSKSRKSRKKTVRRLPRISFV
jgi:hypothetical protein